MGDKYTDQGGFGQGFFFLLKYVVNLQCCVSFKCTAK